MSHGDYLNLVWPLVFLLIMLVVFRQIGNDVSPLFKTVVGGLTQDAGRNADAGTLLTESVRQHPRDPRLHQLQAKNYAALGKRTAQHHSQAEVYALLGSLPAAIEQLQLARSAGDGDFYQMSVVDAKLKELRALHAQELKDQKK